MLLPLHAAANMYAAVNMQVGAVACRGGSDHHGYAGFTTYLVFHTRCHSQVPLSLVGLRTSAQYFAFFSLHIAASPIF